MSSEGSPRDRILQLIRENPGMHFRAIQRESGLAIGQLEYHLYRLEKDEEITIRKDGKFKRYFPYSTGESLKKSLGFHLRNKVSRNIIFLLLSRGEASEERLKDRVGEGWAESVKSLMDDNLVIRDGEVYRLRDPGNLREFIRRSKKSFIEELAESLIDLFDEWKEP
ncbi:MAG: winged helix-turn-helix transcriptional regulator [Candidatus Thermoplasmatota archaeon]|nr:winged helix-turn-helix transcriptional regulator [Candidatus Thermoplasmatota archaeon]MCL5791150.1 winged helix-turn-helix transcriptional regulator [Candidatus Thermoplasmatota archaeon]